ncbi:MAG: VWA domain-containing protein [Candidatus Aminicenantales bacterium]
MKQMGKGPILAAAVLLASFFGIAGGMRGTVTAQTNPENRNAAQDKVADQESREVDVRLVLVDVIATKDGKFFSGLKKSDFRVFEDGKEVKIDSCDLVSHGKSDIALVEAEPGKEAAPSVIVRKRRLAVLFDGLNVWDREYKKAVQRVADELAAMTKQDTEVMILILDEASGLRIVQPFTDQETLIRDAAGKASASYFPPFQHLKDYDTGEASIQMSELREFENRSIKANRLTRMIGGLVASIHMLESLPGRKNLLFVSGGLPDLDRVGSENGLPLTVAKRSFRVFDPFGILGKTLFWTGSEILKEIIRVANDRNISIYSLDPEVSTKISASGPMAENDVASSDGVYSLGAIPGEKFGQLQNLRTLSEKTGAKLLRGADKIESLRQVTANDLSFYYQLSYYPPRSKADKSYHKIEVKLKDGKGVQVKTREGYSDSFIEQSLRVRLAQAYYNPDLFRGKIPFEASFIPFASESGKVQPWLSLALPAQDFFGPRGAEGKKTYEFHFWIKGGDESGRLLAGKVDIPFAMDDAFKERLSSIDFFRLNYFGPEIELEGAGNRIIFALFDPETGEIGTWSSDCPPPIKKGSSEPSFINCVPGYAVSNTTDRKGAFQLKGTEGSLECGKIRFFPKTAGGFMPTEDVHLFIQAYSPQGAPVEARFELADSSGQSREIKGTIAAESWNKSTKIWSAAYKLDLEGLAPGDYVLKTIIPPAGDKSALTREVQISILGTDQDN